MKSLGKHLIIEFHGCNPDVLNDKDILEVHLLEAVRLSGATVITPFFHQFNPHGVTGVVVIAESHFSVHTWPEYGYAALTFETCGKNIDPWKSLGYLQDALQSERCSQIEMYRGMFDVPQGTLPHKPPET